MSETEAALSAFASQDWPLFVSGEGTVYVAVGRWSVAPRSWRAQRAEAAGRLLGLGPGAARLDEWHGAEIDAHLAGAASQHDGPQRQQRSRAELWQVVAGLPLRVEHVTATARAGAVTRRSEVLFVNVAGESEYLEVSRELRRRWARERVTPPPVPSIAEVLGRSR